MDHVAVFARAPVEGAVKTRLSPALPPSLALVLYRGMLADAVETACEARAGSVTLYWEGGEPGSDAVAGRSDVGERRQSGKDLGERLESAFAELLRPPGMRAVVIGADCPDLDPGTVRAAFVALGDHDLVLGPARDGGYYLVGLARPVPVLFRGVPWGSERVFAETVARAGETGLRVHSLDPLDDLDTPADLVGFIARHSVAGPGRGRHTEAALREMGLLPEAR